MDFAFSLFFALHGEIDRVLKLYVPMAGDVVTYEATRISTTDFTYDDPPDGDVLVVFTQDPPDLPDDPLDDSNFLGPGHYYDVNDSRLLIEITDGEFALYNAVLSEYQATRTYTENQWIQEDSGLNSEKTWAWSPPIEGWPGDAEYLVINTAYFGGDEIVYTPDYFFLTITISNPNRTTPPDVPTQFTPEQKAKFLADAEAIDKLTDAVDTLSSAIDPLSAPLAGLNWLVDTYIQAAAPSMGPASATAKTMPEVLVLAGALSESLPEVSPVALTLGVASALNKRTSDLLRFLANDPPDLNYTEVLTFPDSAFTPIPGLSAAGNALIAELYAMLGDVVEMLAAAERYQGADFVDSEENRALQEAAFDDALDAYNQRRAAVADALTAFLAEAAPDDVIFEDDTSLALAQSFFDSLDSLADHPLLNQFITNLINGYLPADLDGNLIIQGILDAFEDPETAPHLSTFAPLTLLGPDFLPQLQSAIANAPASPFTGSVLGALVEVAEFLSTDVTPPPPTGPEVSVTGNGNDIADGDTTPDDADGTAFTGLVGQTVIHTFTVNNSGTEPLKLSAPKLPKGFKVVDKLLDPIPAGGSDTFSLQLDTKKVGNYGGVISFKTNDADEGIFDFTVSASVVEPEIDVLGNGLSIKDGSKKALITNHTLFDTGIGLGDAPAVRTFTISNAAGAADLTISGATLVGGGFTLLTDLTNTVLQGGQSVTFDVAIDTAIAGTRSATIQIVNNDASEALYDFVVTGTVGPRNIVGDDALNDVFVATADPERFVGLNGTDTVSYANGTGPVVASLLPAGAKKNAGFAAGDLFDSIENLIGSDHDDTLTGNDGDNVLEGGAGADKLDGGKGIDTASYANAGETEPGSGVGVTADLLKSKSNLGEAAGDSYKNIENLLGSSFNDTLAGDAKVNALDGGDGDDTLIGNGGIDILTGGLGADTFVFNAIKDGGGATKPGTTGDIILDFESGVDTIGILRKGFKIATTVTEADFLAEYFVSGDGLDTTTPTGVAATATTSKHGQFLFNEDTNQLWWDPDAAGKQAAVLLATFQNGAHVTAGDFLLS